MNRVTEREGGERWKALYGSAFTKLRVSVGTSRIGSNTAGHSTCALPSSGVGRLVLYSQVIGSHRAQSSLVRVPSPKLKRVKISPENLTGRIANIAPPPPLLLSATLSFCIHLQTPLITTPPILTRSSCS